jgi:hypothetical protein
VNNLEKDSVWVTMDEALDRHMPVVPDGIEQVFGRGFQLAPIRQILARNGISRVLAVDQGGNRRRHRNRIS